MRKAKNPGSKNVFLKEKEEVKKSHLKSNFFLKNKTKHFCVAASSHTLSLHSH